MDMTMTETPSVHTQLWMRAPSLALAWLILMVVLVHPPHGLHLPICFLHSATGIPCPGCGLTRSMSCAAHGMLRESWGYHPFGIPFLVIFAALAGSSLLPARARQAVTAWVQR